MFTPAFYRHLASIPIPTDLAPPSSPNVLSYPSLRLYLKFIADIDLRRPRAISAMGMARRYDCSMADVVRAISQLVTNGLLERCCELRARANEGTGVYVIPYKWWLSADEIAQEVDAGVEMRGREELVEDSPLALAGAGAGRQVEAEPEPTSSLEAVQEQELVSEPPEPPEPTSLFLSLLSQALEEGEGEAKEEPPSPASPSPSSNQP
jgi:hypothetical protein